MPDDTKQPAEQEQRSNNPSNGETPQDDQQDAQTPPWGDDFNPERAWSTIQNLRKVEDNAKELDKELKQLKSERQQRAKEAQQADEERLEKQEEYKQLAEKRADRLLELEPLKEKLPEIEAERDKYREALQGYVSAQFEGLPEHIVELLQDRDPVDQLEWLGKNRETFNKTRPQGVPDTPHPNGNAGMTPEEKRKRAALPGRDY